MIEDIYRAISDLVSALEKNQMPYLIGGSFSSSVHGIYRSTNDIDVLLGRPIQIAAPLLNDLKKGFIVDQEALVRNHAQGNSYNIFHETTALKIDLFPARTEFHHEELKRAVVIQPGKDICSFRIASAEDVILSKLVWYEKSKSERQWLDVQGVMQITTNLDRDYMTKWSGVLGVADLLKKLYAGK